MRLNKLLVPLAFSMLFSSAAIGAKLTITNYTQSSNGAIHWVTAALPDLGNSGDIRCVIRMNDLPVGMAEENIKGVGTLNIYINGGTPDATKAECYELDAEGYGEMAD